jgi:hypothetical protein
MKEITVTVDSVTVALKVPRAVELEFRGDLTEAGETRRVARFLGVGIPICSPAVGAVSGRRIGPFLRQGRVERAPDNSAQNRTAFLPQERPSFRAQPLVMSRTITRRAAMTEGQRRIAAAQRARWPERTLAERFWEKVDRSGDCWLWTGCRTPDGYGLIRISGQGRRRTALLGS